MDAVLRNRRAKLKEEIESQDRQYLLNANETELIRRFIEKYRIEPVGLCDQIHVEVLEKMIPAECFDSFRFNGLSGKSYRRQVIRYRLPLKGDHEALRFAASRLIERGLRAIVATLGERSFR